MASHKRAAGTLATAGAFLAAFGGGVLPVAADEQPADDGPQAAAPSKEAGRQAPGATTPVPAPAATTPAPTTAPASTTPATTTPSGDDAPRGAKPPAAKVEVQPGPEDDEPASPAKGDAGPSLERQQDAREERRSSSRSTKTAEECMPRWFVRELSKADRRKYFREHPECAPDDARERRDRRARIRRPDGTPTPADPTFTEALPGPAPIGVPNFFIEKFRIPPFLLPIYQAAGIQYGIRWEVLAAINEIETDYGRNLNVSSAGALGWMQFMPSTWKAYGTDANRDGKRDPYNPVDAIFAAARYLKAAGAETDLRKAVFAYNHADWYVDSVLLRARLIGGLPADLVGSLTGLTQGRFPVHATARYADDLRAADARRRVAEGRNAAIPVEAQAGRRGIDVFADAGSPVVAVQDGKVLAVGHTKRLGRYLKLQDVYGNTYTYGHLGEVVRSYPVPKDLGKAKGKAAPATSPTTVQAAAATSTVAPPMAVAPGEAEPKERLFAHPRRPRAYTAGGRDQLAPTEVYEPLDAERLGLDRDEVEFKPLRKGAKVVAGTVLARIGGKAAGRAPHLRFEIRPAGRGAPRIDPKPILDGWKLLESTAVYRAAGRNPLLGESGAPIGQVLLMSKEDLQRRVLANPRIDLYECGRRDVQAGVIDRRVLATLEYLAAGGLRPSVTSLRCGHGVYTASGNVSHHVSGNAVDIAQVNGIPILGHQGPGSVTEMAIRRLLTLQGTMKPAQIISLMTFEGADNTFSLPDHADHIHVGFQPADPNATQKFDAVLKPEQWIKLIDRLGEIKNPAVPQPGDARLVDGRGD
ncbi:lytic murein transglycosylase [Conexibacter sp. SYSU D00693]|uniref:lytic murein transglycosylase n=1 Tax=Conexibacter sp. SYSU D00693 TaxID=2812560 RepID=UPI00196A89D8|nr:lytic murein transglycosylase [Conexibacter sp. SYSU D00693]